MLTTKLIAKSATWTAISRTISICLKFLTLPILARILQPEEFGAIAISVTLTLFISMLGSIGLPSALIANKEDSTLIWNQAFSLGILISCALAWFLYVFSDYFGELLGEPILIIVLTSLCLLIPITILGDYSEAMLTKRMFFGKIAYWRVVSESIGALIAIIAAIYGLGIWSLVLQQYIAAFIRLVGNLYTVKFIPKFIFDFTGCISMLPFGLRIMISDILLFSSIRVPVIIVTRMLGIQYAGYYSVSNRFVELPNQIVLTSITSVLFPSFVTMHNDPVRMNSVLLQSIQLITSIQAPLMFGLAVIAEPIISMVFGIRWVEAWPIFMILALSKAVISPCGPFYSYLKAVGKVSLLWKSLAIRLLLIVTACIGGAAIGGVIGLAYGILLANSIFMLIYSVAVFREAGINIAYGLEIILSIFLQASFMGLLVLLFSKVLFPQNLNNILEILYSTVLGISIYSVMIWFFQNNTKRLLKKYIGLTRSIIR